MMPAIATRPQAEAVNGQPRKAPRQEPENGAFGTLLELPAREVPAADENADETQGLPGQAWSLPFSLLASQQPNGETGLAPEIVTAQEDAPDETDADDGEGLADLVLPSTLILQTAPPSPSTRGDAVREGPAEQPSTDGAEDTAKPAATSEPAKTAHVVAGTTAPASAPAPGAQVATAQANPVSARPVEQKTAPGRSEQTRQPGLAKPAEVLSAQTPSPATPAATSSDAIAAWNAGRADLAETDGNDDDAKSLIAQPAPTAPPTSLPATVASPVAAPAPLALDPVEQPVLVQAARNVTAAEVEQRGNAATERLTLQLKPIDLGAVTAVLHSANGTLSVELHVENIEAHHRLSHEKEAIGKALRDLGLDVGLVTVQQAVQPAQALDRDQSTNLSNGNGSRNESASWSAGEGRRNDGSSSRDGGGDRQPGSPGSGLRSPETGRERSSGGRYI